MISKYTTNFSKEPKGKLTLTERYERVQGGLQDAVAESYVNTEFIQSTVEHQMQANIATQEWMGDRTDILQMQGMANIPFTKPELNKDTP
jgi:hypothetical protein